MRSKHSRARMTSIGAAAAAGAMLVAACSSSHPSNSASKGSASAPAAGTTSSAAAGSTAASGKVVKLSFWYGLGGNLGKTVVSFVDAFNQSHPNIQVNATFQGSYSGGGPEQQKLLAAVAAGNPPDLAQMEVNSGPSFVQSLRPITDLMNSSADSKPSDFLPGVLAATQVNGQYYGLPWNRSAPVIIYNKTMFDAHGISSPPATWQDLAADAKKLTTAGVVGFEPVAQWWFTEAGVMSGGAQMLSDDLKSAKFATPQALVVPNIRQQMIKDGTAKPHNSKDPFGDTIADFGNQKTAMADMTNSSLSAIDAAVNGKFQWGVATWPKVSGTKYALPPGGANIAMFKAMPDSKVQAAWTFMQWMDSTAETVKWSEQTGYAPVKKAALDDADYKSFLSAHPQFSVPLQELQYTVSPPASPQYYGVLEYVQEAQTKAWFSGVSIGDTLAAAAKQTNQLLGG